MVDQREKGPREGGATHAAERAFFVDLVKKGTSEGGKKTLFPFFFRGQKISTFSSPLQRKLCTFKATHDGRCGKLKICSLCPEQREEQERERNEGKGKRTERMERCIKLARRRKTQPPLSTSTSSTPPPPTKQRRKSEMHRCEVCQTWLKNHPAVIAMHEQGAGHNAAVAKSKKMFFLL